MSAPVKTSGGRRGPRSLARLRQALAGTALAGILAFAVPAGLQAADCPADRQPNLPKSEEPADNIDKHKERLTAYHDKEKGGSYENDIAQVIDDARGYVTRRADSVKRPAVVLDIDETSLTNWPNIKANDYGFILGGPCFQEPGLSCGFNDWILKASAPAIAPTLDFFNFVRDRNIAVFFITGRRNSQRDATILNLDHAGFQGWAGLVTRPDDDHDLIEKFKSHEREKIANNGDKSYTIIANIGDQRSDLVDRDGNPDKIAECNFKLPNPFYFIK